MLRYIKNLLWPEDIKVLSTPKIEYLLNDPTTPELVELVSLPSTPKRLKFNVRGYKPGIVTGRAVNCHITVGSTINYMEKIGKRVGFPFRKWASTRNLTVIPNAGHKLNAYYNKRSLVFFNAINPLTNKPIFTADSADVVAHELGHALLDSLRPDIWRMQGTEIWAFHEAFADITAILSRMQYDTLLHLMLKETGGNLLKSNVVSRIGEELGGVAYKVTKGIKGNPKFLRDATVLYKYVSPSNLPKETLAEQLANEPHSFGRVFLSAWYRYMVGIFNREIKTKRGLEAIKIARDTAAQTVIKAAATAPRVTNFLNAVAKNMYINEKQSGANNEKIIKQVFEKSNILKSNQIKLLSYTEEPMAYHSIKRQKIIKLSDLRVSAQSGQNYLQDVEIEITAVEYLVLDKNGTVIDQIVNDEEAAIKDAVLCASIIEGDERVKNMWEIKKGKLERKYIE